MRCCLLTFLFLNSFWLQAQTPIRLQGTVVDARTGEPLPFAYIVVNQGVMGGNTDFDGRFDFTMQTSVEQVAFTHVGYEDFLYVVNAPEDLQPLQRVLRIPLSPNTTPLVFPVYQPNAVLAYNPAHALIQKALRNRALHNPKNIPFYSYNSYNRFQIDLEPAQKIVLPARKDSAKYKIAMFMQHNYLFLAETVTNFQRRTPTFQTEKILANRVSGFQNPQYLALSTQAQLLNFYEDYLTFLNRKYLNPISPEAQKRYVFAIEDTVLVKPDTIFWIAFKPVPHKFFDGLQGRIALHSRTFAIQSIEIESALPEKEVGLGFRLAQRYEWVNKQYWFPQEVRLELVLRRVKIGNRRMLAQWRTHINDLDFKNKPRWATFRDVMLQVSPEAHQQTPDFWVNYRRDSLSRRALQTYTSLDTVGKQARFDSRLAFAQHLPLARVPIPRWKMDFDLRHAFNLNRYEFIRLGVGFVTNSLFSKKYNLGAYLDYGTRDGNFKYGFSAQYRPLPAVDASVSARYVSDVQEPARVRFSEANMAIVFPPNRDFFTSRMDKVRLFELKAQGRVLQNFRVETSFRTKRVLPTYDYYFLMQGENGVTNIYTHHYQMTEVNFQLNYFWGARYLRLDNLWALAKRLYPTFYLSYTQGVRALGSDFRYGKWEARLAYEHTFRHLGTTHGELWLGWSKGQMPYQALWNGQGEGKTSPPMVANYFQAMGTYEFLMDRFTYIFLRHNFKKLLFKSPYPWFQPVPILHHNIGWGNLRNATAHIGIETKTLRKPYWESGFMINDVLKTRFKKTLKVGIGGGAFLRYGAHRDREKFGNNWAYKVSFSFGI